MYCKQCGKKIEDDSVFCRHCGTLLGPAQKNPKKPVFLQISNIACLIGVITILSGFFMSELTVGDRILHVIIGTGVCIFAKFNYARWAAISLIAFSLAIAGFPLMWDDSGAFDFAGLMTEILFLGIAFFFGRKTINYLKKNTRNVSPIDSWDYADSSYPCTGINEIEGLNVITTEEALQEFRCEHILAEEINTKVVGVTYKNDDGSSRQEYLSLCEAGDEVFFYSHKYKGEPALAVLTRYGQIGFLSATLAKSIDLKYQECTLQGTITQITGGVDGLKFGCNLHINVYVEKTFTK